MTFTNPALAGDTSSDEDDAPLRTKKDWFSKKKKGEGGQDSEQKKSGNVVMSSLQSGPMTLSGVFGDSDNSDGESQPIPNGICIHQPDFKISCEGLGASV